MFLYPKQRQPSFSEWSREDQGSGAAEVRIREAERQVKKSSWMRICEAERKAKKEQLNEPSSLAVRCPPLLWPLFAPIGTDVRSVDYTGRL